MITPPSLWLKWLNLYVHQVFGIWPRIISVKLYTLLNFKTVIKKDFLHKTVKNSKPTFFLFLPLFFSMSDFVFLFLYFSVLYIIQSKQILFFTCYITSQLEFSLQVMQMFFFSYFVIDLVVSAYTFSVRMMLSKLVQELLRNIII